jgi:hypothetical protein
MGRWLRLLSAGLGLGWVLAAAAEPVTLVRESALRAEPSLFAATVATVGKGVTGESVGKSGIWINVKTAEGSGWVFTFNLRHGGERTAGSGGDAGSFVSARPRTQVVSTIGIRGLSEEDLQNAAFDRAEMQRLEAFSATRLEAERHAHSVGLQPAQIEELEEQ